MSYSAFPEDVLQQAVILVVDDEEPNVRLLERTLGRWGYHNVVGTTDSTQTLALVERHRPDLVLLDLMMPGMDGFEVMNQMHATLPPGAYLPVLVLTADISTQAKRKALAAGAKDFLTKPLDLTELLLRMRNMIEIRLLHSRLHQQNENLEQKVSDRTRELEMAQFEILDRLGRAAEFRDDDTGHHTQRVSQMATSLARQFGLPGAKVQLIRRAAALHDVGKIGIPDVVLLKPGKLTPEEFGCIKTHTTIGAALLSGGGSELVQMAESIALTHHEHWDGNGYPRGLSGADIPVEGRILAVADVLDALTHERPYKKAWSIEDSVAEIRDNSGRQFDPGVVEAFMALYEAAQLDTCAIDDQLL